MKKLFQTIWLILCGVTRNGCRKTLKRKELKMAKKEEAAMTVKITDSTLVITIPVIKPLKPSKSGKSLTVATTHGNVTTEAQVQGKPLVVGVNAYIKA